MSKSQNKKPGFFVIRNFSFVICILSWGLRLCCLEQVPPGWRDDELINLYTLSGQLLEGRFPLYFTGASGHEPLYHYLHAGLIAILGFNVLSAHFLSAAFGTLTVALTYALARRLFGRTTAAIAALSLSFSFWSLMYSRFGMRHISTPAFALAFILLLLRSFSPVICPYQPSGRATTRDCPYGLTLNLNLNPLAAGLLLGLSLYTYTASRLLPVLLILFAAYLALNPALKAQPRDRFRSRWRDFASSLAVIMTVFLLTAAPLGIAIAQGRSSEAAQGIGADARLSELALPLRELRAGNPRPLLETTWKTLGMFHATGDPEWLYNIANRPVFNLFGGTLLWGGVALCLYRWRQPRYFLMLLWLALGLLPAFISIPPASLSHTILAQPVVYILPALALTEFSRWLRTKLSSYVMRHTSFVICHLSFVILPVIFHLSFIAVRDLRDYFFVWPRQDMVRILYRADYREAARYLETRPEIGDVAVSSALLGPWDRLALSTDVGRDDVAIRLFNPERALVWAAGAETFPVLLTSWPTPTTFTSDYLQACELQAASLRVCELQVADCRFARHLQTCHLQTCHLPTCPLAHYSNGLTLSEACWLDEALPSAEREISLLTRWRVAAPLELPPMPVVANPPPPGIYTGPRLHVFAHLLDGDGNALAIDDGLWVDPLTLRTGDQFLQVHRFALPADVSVDDLAVEIGLYDPKTGERWSVLDSAGQPAADRLLLRE